MGAGGSGGRDHGYGLKPAGGPVDDGKQMCETAGWRQWTDKVYVEVEKNGWWYQNVLGSQVGMAAPLGTLAWDALVHPHVDQLF